MTFICHCGEGEKPVYERNWVVMERTGTSRTWYRVTCRSCGATGWTAGWFAENLAGGIEENDDEQDDCSGRTGRDILSTGMPVENSHD